MLCIFLCVCPNCSHGFQKSSLLYLHRSFGMFRAAQGFRETFSALCIALLQASLYAMTCSSIHSKKAPARHLCFICQSSFLRALQGKASAIAPLYRQSSRCGTGSCKASRLHSPWSILLLKGSARPQQGFTILIQTFFSRALQGLYD